MQLTNIGKQAFTLASSISSSVGSGACYRARGVAKLGSATVSVMTKSVSFIGSSITKIGSVALGALKSLGNGLVAGAKHIPKNRYTLLAVGAALATAVYAKNFFKKSEIKADEAEIQQPEVQEGEAQQLQADGAQEEEPQVLTQRSGDEALVATEPDSSLDQAENDA